MQIQTVCFVAQHQVLLDRLEEVITNTNSHPLAIEAWSSAYTLFTVPQIILSQEEYDAIDPALRKQWGAHGVGE